MPAHVTLPSVRHRLFKGHHDRIARALADQVEDDLLQQRFDTGRYDGNMRSVTEELQKRGTIRPAKREEIANHGIDLAVGRNLDRARNRRFGAVS